MPSSRQFLEEGYDPTADPCISVSTLLQMFRASLPHTDIGYIISAEETALPDVILYPEVARFLVRGLSVGVPTGNIYFYNGASWQLIFANLFLADGSLDIVKLSTTGSTPYDIIRVNIAGTAFEFISIVNAIAVNSLPIDRLSTINPFAGTLVTEGGAISWKSYGDLWTALFSNASPVGNNRDILYINGTVLAFGSINTILPNYTLEWRKIKYGTNTVGISTGAITVDASLSGNHKVSLTEDVTSVLISNMVDGQTLQILFKQDGVGGRTVDFTGSNINWVGGSAPTITVTAEHGDIVSISLFDGQLVGVFVQDVDLT